jgi:N-acyl-D-aspartate/D-glutamate deacylase
VKGNALAMMRLGAGFVVGSGVLALALAMAGRLAERGDGPLVLAVVGAVAILTAAARLPGWARERARQMDSIAAKVRDLVICLTLFSACTGGTDRYDLVIHGGRVIDPETNLDAVRDVGITGGRIAAVSTGTLQGSRVIDAAGLVVAPGFIDLHQHQHDSAGYILKAMDGVTTALEMETGVPDYAAFLAARAGKTLINYGATASQEAARVVAWGDTLTVSVMGPAAAIDDPASSPATDDPPTPAQLDRLLAFLTAQLDAGALGIGIGLEYTPGATRLEVIRMFQLAARRGLPVFVHIRSAGRLEPGSSIESVSEMIAASAISGAPVHIVHVNSSCLAQGPECLEMIAGARERGIDVTTEAYPYGAGMTSIASALFNPGWRERRGLDYSAIEIPATAERLTKERFDQLHGSATPQYVLIHSNPDSVVDAIIEHPLTMIASDGLHSHPRSAGTYGRILARHVRDRKSLTLLEAVRKMSLMPAQRLETITAAAKRKGRVQTGADADLVVFDPATVSDRSTYRAPAEPSVGMKYVMVGGTLVVDGGSIVASVAPGQPIAVESSAAPTKAAPPRGQ